MVMTDARRVVVIGAGYAGLTAALGVAGRARRLRVGVTLVNRSARFTERLRLHQTASGQRLAELSIPAMVAGTGIEFVQGRVTAVDPEQRRVGLADGRELPYDVLVWALGSRADPGTVPGVVEHAYTLDDLIQAQRLAERLDGLADAQVVVAGAGLTGLEAAAEFAESYPGLRVVLLGREAPGSAMRPRARGYLDEALDRLGVRVRRGVRVTKVLPDAVELAGGELIDSDATLWTAGVRCAPLAREAGITVDSRGRIVVDGVLRSISHPGVYAVGDAAEIRQPWGTIHGTCGSAIPAGAHAAASIARQLAGRAPKPFRFGYVHQPVSLGRHDALVQFTAADETPRRLVLTGPAAVAYKEIVSSTPWPAFRLLKAWPGALRWPSGGRATR